MTGRTFMSSMIEHQAKGDGAGASIVRLRSSPPKPLLIALEYRFYVGFWMELQFSFVLGGY